MKHTLRELQALYNQGKNITQVLRAEMGLDQNTGEIIEIAYDLQAGSYIAAMRDEAMSQHKREYASEIATTILSLCRPMSVMEAGVGEATTLSGVLRNLPADVASFGFDLSWSRVALAQGWLASQGVSGSTLCTGNLFDIPFAENSIDVVYTSHSIEPNGGNEEPILRELFRVARKFLILLEPAYELAGDEARARMDVHGYCRNIRATCESLGHDVLTHELFPCSVNPLNPTAITIIAKESGGPTPSHILACPRFKTPLLELGGMMFSREALTVYPVLGGVPCLRIENGILASKFEEIVGDGPHSS